MVNFSNNPTVCISSYFYALTNEQLYFFRYTVFEKRRAVLFQAQGSVRMEEGSVSHHYCTPFFP